MCSILSLIVPYPCFECSSALWAVHSLLLALYFYQAPPYLNFNFTALCCFSFTVYFMFCCLPLSYMYRHIIVNVVGVCLSFLVLIHAWYLTTLLCSISCSVLISFCNICSCWLNLTGKIMNMYPFIPYICYHDHCALSLWRLKIKGSLICHIILETAIHF